MTYLEFHFVFTIPLILVEIFLLKINKVKIEKKSLLAMAFLCFIAFIYTTPWDNYLVKNEVWWYEKDRILFVIGYVPFEEYLFFILQTLLSGLFFHFIFKQNSFEVPKKINGLINVGVLFFLMTLSLISISFLMSEKSFYLGLILVWSLPVVCLQWIYAGSFIMKNRLKTFLSVFIPTFYLSLCDSYAIKEKIWMISSRYTLNFYLGNLPLEEALFFLMTNILVVFGLIAFLCHFNKTSLKELFTLGYMKQVFIK